jgi:hypothetical protein
VAIYKVTCLILINWPPTYLFSQVFNDLRSRRHISDQKLIDLLNQSFFLRDSKALSIFRICFGPRSSDASKSTTESATGKARS